MKVDFKTREMHNANPMQKTLNANSVKLALQGNGWSQKELAAAVGVSAQSVTNWLKGADFPRPDKLLKLATTLRLRLDQLVLALPERAANQPVVAFRRRAATKTTEAHIAKAQAMGALLGPLVPHLPPLRALRTAIAQPSTAYADLQRTVAQTRDKLGLGQKAVLDYATLIGEFAANDAFLVPVLWGAQQHHGNALHILLPAQHVTFVYLNLDTFIEDFKFWMAHELAHVYTPEWLAPTLAKTLPTPLPARCSFRSPWLLLPTAKRPAPRAKPAPSPPCSGMPKRTRFRCSPSTVRHKPTPRPRACRRLN